MDHLSQPAVLRNPVPADQIRELYRIAYANRTFTDLADEMSQKAEGPGLKYQGPLSLK
jgi:hypothetical protein